MTLHDYFLEQPRGAKTQMALALGITKTWLSQVLSGHHRPSPYLAKAIQKYTKGAVTSKDLRPDIFNRYDYLQCAWRRL